MSSDMNRPDEAVQYYLEAEHWGRKTNDYQLLYSTTTNLGAIYEHLNLNDSTLSVYKRALEYARLAEDRLSVANAECHLGQAYALEEKWNTSIYYYDRAIRILIGTDYLNAIGGILNECVSAAINMKDWNLAKDYLRELHTVPLADRQDYQFQIDLNKGRYYRGIGDDNSSRYYLSKATASENPYVRRDSFLQLYLLERQTKNYEAAFEYLDSYDACKDVIEAHSEKTKITRLPELYKNKLLQEENDDLKFKHYFYVAVSTSIILFLFCIYVIRRNRFQKKVLLLYYATEYIKKLKRQVLQNEETNEKLNREIAGWKKKYRLEKTFKTEEQIKKAVLLIQLKNNPVPIEKEQWAELFLTVDILFDNFSKRLKETYPGLSDVDMQYCCLFKAGFSIKQIAILQMVDSKSVSRRKIEIRKRMGLDVKLDVMKVCKNF